MGGRPGGGAKPADLPVDTGLGLVISKRFCQMMGGDITVESELGAASLVGGISRDILRRNAKRTRKQPGSALANNWREMTSRHAP